MKSLKTTSHFSLLVVLTVTLSLASSSLCVLACKKAILRSFGMTGLEKADKNNALCPGNKNNCCTKMDMMKVHKLWQKHVKNLVIGNHKINVSALAMLQQVIKDRKEMDLKTIYDDFKKTMKPSKFFDKKFVALAKRWSAHSFKNIAKTYGGLKKVLTKFKKSVLHMRKGFMCSMCSHNSHTYFTPEENSVTYSVGFCNHLIKTNIAALKMKYVDLWDYLMVVSEIFTLLTEETFFTEEDVKYYNTFIPVIAGCHKSPGLKACQPLCEEFNLNKFTNIWDGEKIPLEHFKTGYDKVWPKLKEKANWKTMFKYDKDKWMALEKEEKDKIEAEKKAAAEAAKAKENAGKEKKSEEKKEEKPAVVVPKLSDEDKTLVMDSSFKIQFLPNSISSTLAKTPGPQVEKIEGTDDDAAEYRLFKLVPKPISFSTLEIKIASIGIDLHTVAAGNNLETSPEQIIRLIFAKGAEIKPLDEPISDDVKALLQGLSFKEIHQFVNDAGIQFDRYISKKPRKSTLRKKKSILGLQEYFKSNPKPEANADDKPAEGTPAAE